MLVSDHTELLTLHRLMMERHFVRQVHATELIGSPIVARLANQVLDELIEAEVRIKDEGARDHWAAWRVLDSSKGVVWDNFLARVRAARQYLSDASPEDRVKFIMYVASPFHLADTVLKAVIADTLSGHS